MKRSHLQKDVETTSHAARYTPMANIQNCSVTCMYVPLSLSWKPEQVHDMKACLSHSAAYRTVGHKATDDNA